MLLSGPLHLVAASQHSDQQSFFHIDAFLSAAIAIAIAAGAAVASMAFTFSWSERVYQDIFPNRDDTKSGHSKTDTRTALIVTAFMITNAIALPTNAIITVLTVTTAQITLDLMTGTFIQGVGAILFRLSNVLTNNLTVNAIYYVTPCRTVVWLLFLHQPIPNLHYLAAGTFAIITANLILALRPIRTSP